MNFAYHFRVRDPLGVVTKVKKRVLRLSFDIIQVKLPSLISEKEFVSVSVEFQKVQLDLKNIYKKNFKEKKVVFPFTLESWLICAIVVELPKS